MPNRLMASLRVGVCGFPEAREKLFRDFSVIEVQRTFYQPPRPATAARRRADAPHALVFALKAWRVVAHEETVKVACAYFLGLTDETMLALGLANAEIRAFELQAP